MKNQHSTDSIKLARFNSPSNSNQTSGLIQASPKRYFKAKKAYTTPRKQESIDDIKQKLMINRAIEGILTMGRLQRMKYVTVNNKALFNQGKIKRAQWINRKNSNRSQGHFLPDLKHLRVQKRAKKQSLGTVVTKVQQSPKSRIQLSHNKAQVAGTPSKRFSKIYGLNSSHSVQLEQKSGSNQENYQSLIEQFICKVQSQDLLLKYNRQQLVQKACQQIKMKLAQKSQQPVQKASSFISMMLNKNSINNQQKLPFQVCSNSLVKKRNKKRSVTQITYEDQIQKIRKNQNYRNQQRLGKQKLFLRRIKVLSLKNKSIRTQF